MGGSDLGCCANAIRVTLVIINIIFGVVGIVVLAIGIWALVENQDLMFIFGDTFLSGGGILVVAGVVTLIICFIGIFGAVLKARPLLVTYAIIVAIIIVLEIVAAIVVFVFRDSILDELESNSIMAIQMYRVNEDAQDFNRDANNAVDAFQNLFECCGFNNATDWINENAQAILDNFAAGIPRPPSCDACDLGVDRECERFRFSVDMGGSTRELNFTTTNVGCGNFTAERFTIFAASVGGIGLAVGLTEILCAVFAIALCFCITSARKQEVV